MMAVEEKFIKFTVSPPPQGEIFHARMCSFPSGFFVLHTSYTYFIINFSVWLAACVGCGAGGALYAVSFYSVSIHLDHFYDHASYHAANLTYLFNANFLSLPRPLWSFWF